jgi:hypothetical protein
MQGQPTYQARQHAHAREVAGIGAIPLQMSPITRRLVDSGAIPTPTPREREEAASQRRELIDAGMLRPGRDDGLVPFQLPPGMPVLRQDERSKRQAQAEARRWLRGEALEWN